LRWRTSLSSSEQEAAILIWNSPHSLNYRCTCGWNWVLLLSLVVWCIHWLLEKTHVPVHFHHNISSIMPYQNMCLGAMQCYIMS
jgi:hypothetical protein